MRRPAHPLRWLLGALVLLAVLVVAVPYAYIHLVEGDPPPEFAASTSASPVAPVSPAPVPAGTPASTVAGQWQVAPGSRAGYRVGEVLAGQQTTAVGRTTAVTGGLTATETQVTQAAFTVDLTKVSSDQSRRDAQFRGPIMQTSTYPTAVFTLVDPVDLGELATSAGTRTVPVHGTLALHGRTNDVAVPLTVVRSGAQVEISGQIPVRFDDYGIDDPSIGGFVKTEDSGTVEVLLTLTRG